jgi:hypothetical protein
LGYLDIDQYQCSLFSTAEISKPAVGAGLLASELCCAYFLSRAGSLKARKRIRREEIDPCGL